MSETTTGEWPEGQSNSFQHDESAATRTDARSGIASVAASASAASATPTERTTTIESADTPRTHAAVKQIEALRSTIDNIDAAVIHLLAERFKATSRVGVLKAQAGFAPADLQREEQQIERLRSIARDAGLDMQIAEMYKQFVVEEAKKRHQRIIDAGGDPGTLDVYA
jgi:chorismate mutase